MAKSASTGWPRTPDDTIDWEVVFDHPETGLVPIILKAPTPVALRECTRVVIEQLYTRPDDPEEVKRFIAELEQLVPDDTPAATLPLIGQAVGTVLRRIKDERLEQAARFVAEQRKAKQQGKAADPVESSDDGKKPAAERRKSPKRKAPNYKALVLGGAGIGLTAAAGIAVFFLIGGGEKPKTPNQVLLDQIRLTAKGEGPPTHIFGGTLYKGVRAGRIMVTVEGVPTDACFNVVWPLANKGNVAVDNVMPRRIAPPVLKELCSQGPKTHTVHWIPRKVE